MRISRSALSQWPPVLPSRLEDRVLAALARRLLPADVLAGLGLPPPEAAATQEANTP